MRQIFTTSLLISSLSLSACNTTTFTQDFNNLKDDVLSALPSLASLTGNPESSSSITQTDITQAFKQALNIGTDKVITRLGQKNGFNNDPNIHIPLPSSLTKVQNILNTAGLSFLLDDLETRLNRAAEIATPHAKELFINAILDMKFEDVMRIYNGPDDSATAYFRSKMSAPLAVKMKPLVNNAVAQAGVINSYDKILAQYQAAPFMPDVKEDLSDYVVGKGVDGIFYYIAEQEKAIRQDPVRQTTSLLKKVFGSQNQ